MNILAFDTAMSGCSVAVLAGGNCVSEFEPMTRGQSEALAPMVERVMKESGLAFDALDSICTTRGPGAFTGLRIGLSMARSFGVALQKPVIGLTTLEILAAQFFETQKLDDGQSLCVLIETKRSDFYFQFFGNDAQPQSEPAAAPAQDIAAMVQGATVFIGDALARFQDLCRPEGGTFTDGFVLPDPRMMAQMAAAGRGGAAEPLYLREADVTIAAKK